MATGDDGGATGRGRRPAGGRRGTLPLPRGPAEAAPGARRADTPVALRLAATGRDVPLSPEDAPFTIGSAAGNSLVVADRHASAFHCELERRGPRRFVLRDLGSLNGTYVNGGRIYEAEVSPGVRLIVGSTALTLVGRRARPSPPAAELLIGDDPAFRTAVDRALRVARGPGTTSVLILGESGTGKELVARLIHEASARAAGPFVAVNCGAIARELVESELFGHERGAFTGASERRTGLFEQADGGTVFLDEVGELPREQQPRLLRVLETRRVRRVGGEVERPIDVRIVAATHRDLATAAARGEFRLDLYHRLAGLELPLPALRDRPGDLPALVDWFLAEVAAEHGPRRIAPETLAALARHPWPGNVRELRNAIVRASVLADDELRLEDLLPGGAPEPFARRAAGDSAAPLVARERGPARGEWGRPAAAAAPALRVARAGVGAGVPDGAPPSDPLEGMTVDDMMRVLLGRALARFGSQRRAAAALGMSKSTFHDKARRYGLVGAPPAGEDVPRR